MDNWKGLLCITLICSAVMICGCSGTAKGAYYEFPSYERNITYAGSGNDCLTVVPVAAGEILHVNVTMDANASFLNLDPAGAGLMLGISREDTSGMTYTDIFNHTLEEHTLYGTTSYDNASYDEWIYFGNDSLFCLMVWPWDLSQPIAGHISVTRYSTESETILSSGLNGDDVMVWYNSMQATTTTTVDTSGSDTIPWSPFTENMSDFDNAESADNNDGFGDWGPMTGPNLSSVEVDGTNNDLGLASGVPITGPTGNYVPYHSSSYVSSSLNEEIAEVQERQHEIDMENAADRATYFQQEN